jgi:chromosome segregation ATPase
MDARQQAHINQLTEQLRSTEHISKKLRQELAQAQTQMKAERASLHDQRLKEAQAWKVGIELTKASFQVTQARLLLLLDMEGRNVLSKEDDLRSEMLEIIERDCDLIQFRQQVDDLEGKVIELQKLLELERQEREKGDQEYEELRRKFTEVVGKYGKLKGKCSALLAKSAEIHRDLERSGTKVTEMEVRGW